MDLVRHSIHWARGEIFEMTIIALSGAALAIIGLASSRLGGTPLAKAMLVPLLVLGLLFLSIGVSGYATNRRRIPAFEQAYRENPAAFVLAEKERVDGFQYMYAITNVIAPISFALAVGLFWLSLNPRARAAGIGLAVFGLSGLLIDGFSKERADAYYARVLEALARPTPGATHSSDSGSGRER